MRHPRTSWTHAALWAAPAIPPITVAAITDGWPAAAGLVIAGAWILALLALGLRDLGSRWWPGDDDDPRS